jgi:deoxyribonuclease V
MGSQPPFSPWPTTAAELVAAQTQLGNVAVPPWPGLPEGGLVAGCFVCFARGRSGPGAAGDPGWAAACLFTPSGERLIRVIRGLAGAGYEPGLLALRDSELLETALRRLRLVPHLLVVNATGRDHPRRAGLALQLGARLDVPSIGVTNRPLLATGPVPEDTRGAASPLRIGSEVVAHWVRTRRGTRPLVAHAGWRTDADDAVELLLELTPRWRTPVVLRCARQEARQARAAEQVQAQGVPPPATLNR